MGATAPGPSFSGRPVGQVGIVVRDLDTAAERLSLTVAAGPWRIYTYSGETLAERTYRGRPGAFAMRLALNAQTPMIELIQPLEGPSIYHEWLDTHGEGLHHLAVWVDSVDAAIAEMAAAGFGVLQSGRGFGAGGDGAFAYFDTGPALGVVYEAVELPARRREPERMIA